MDLVKQFLLESQSAIIGGAGKILLQSSKYSLHTSWAKKRIPQGTTSGINRAISGVEASWMVLTLRRLGEVSYIRVFLGARLVFLILTGPFTQVIAIYKYHTCDVQINFF